MPHDAAADLTLPPLQQAIRAQCFHRTGTFVPFPREAIEQAIPSRFEQQVQLYPDRLAVRCPTRALSYDELNQAANRVAHAILARRGKGSEPVVLLFDHGTQFVVAILGVLKAAKAYVPLDPMYPHARLTYMIEDAQAGLIITDTRNLSLAQQLAHGAFEILNTEEL